jgi:hypothetical protein
VWQLLGLKKLKMAAVAMVTNVQKMLNSFQSSQSFATDSDCFGLFRSTRCRCCSYQVSSISVRSYDVSWSLMKEIFFFY